MSVLLPNGQSVRVASIDLPAGNYIVQAKGQISTQGEGGSSRVNVTCEVTGTKSGQLDEQRVTTLPLMAETTEMLATFTTTGEVVSLNCRNQTTIEVHIEDAWLVGLQVDPLLSTVETAAPVP